MCFWDCSLVAILLTLGVSGGFGEKLRSRGVPKEISESWQLKENWTEVTPAKRRRNCHRNFFFVAAILTIFAKAKSKTARIGVKHLICCSDEPYSYLRNGGHVSVL